MGPNVLDSPPYRPKIAANFNQGLAKTLESD